MSLDPDDAIDAIDDLDLLRLTVPGTAERNVKYGAGVRQRYDLYWNPAVTGPMPVCIYLHAGAWARGGKTDGAIAAIGAPLIAQGVAFVTSNYRLAPILWPAQGNDMTKLLQSLAGFSHVDLMRIAWFGISAGAQIGFWAASTLPGARCAAGWYGPSDLRNVSVQAENFIPRVFGPPGDAKRWDASPLRVAATAPPTLLAYGETDTMIPEATQGRPYRDALAVNEYHVVPGGHIESWPELVSPTLSWILGHV